MPEEHKQIAMAAVGAMNIFAGILSTLQNFLRYAELMELCIDCLRCNGQNLVIMCSGRASPQIQKTQIKPRFLEKASRAEYDRLIETISHYR